MTIPGFLGVELQHIIKIILALILGSIIGLERKTGHKPAGLRTHALVCLGATLISIISIDYFGGDPARIAAGVVTGIGFLGAGAIIASRGNVRGLTTAASLWVMAAVGLGIGAGAYTLSAIVTLVVLGVLIFGRMKKVD
ncbi:MgtC/SapB family protein [Candidatus Woesearchaeota archaeon]|nr:MgtC/SapB family protein [Candidatus Woesearchaeota archaeon]